MALLNKLEYNWRVFIQKIDYKNQSGFVRQDDLRQASPVYIKNN